MVLFIRFDEVKKKTKLRLTEFVFLHLKWLNTIFRSISNFSNNVSFRIGWNVVVVVVFDPVHTVHFHPIVIISSAFKIPVSPLPHKKTQKKKQRTKNYWNHLAIIVE